MNVLRLTNKILFVLGSVFAMYAGACGLLTQARAESTPPDPAVKVLSLEEAIHYALENNRNLAKSAMGLTSSQIAIDTAKSNFDLKIVPASSISYGSESEKTWLVGTRISKQLESGPNVYIRPGIGQNSGEGYSNVAVGLNVPLLRGAGEAATMDGVYSSLYSYETAKTSHYQQQVSTVLQTVQSVYSSIQKGLQIELLEKQLKMLQDHLGLAKIKEKAGVVGALDVYRAEIRIKTIQEELTTLRGEQNDLLGEVKKVLAVPQNGEVVISASIDYSPLTTNLDEAIAIAQRNRIEIEQTNRLIKENERQLLLAKKNILPQLDLQLTYNRTGDDSTLNLPDESWYATVTSDSDIFRNSEKNAYLQAQIRYKQILLDQAAEKEDINQQVRAEINALDKQQQKISLREEQLQQTKGKMQLAESKFRNGMADNFTLIEAQTELQTAEANNLVERIAYIVRTYHLRSTLGTLLEREVAKK